MDSIEYWIFCISFIFGFSMLMGEIVKDKLIRFLIGTSISIAICVLVSKIFLN